MLECWDVLIKLLGTHIHKRTSINVQALRQSYFYSLIICHKIVRNKIWLMLLLIRRIKGMSRVLIFFLCSVVYWFVTLDTLLCSFNSLIGLFCIEGLINAGMKVVQSAFKFTDQKIVEKALRYLGQDFSGFLFSFRCIILDVKYCWLLRNGS